MSKDASLSSEQASEGETYDNSERIEAGLAGVEPEDAVECAEE